MSETTHRSPRFAGLRGRRLAPHWRLHFACSPDPMLIGVAIEIGHDRTIIGRQAEGVAGELVMADDAMSRRHAVIVVVNDGEGLEAIDLGSRNGTFVDGLAVDSGLRQGLPAGAPLPDGAVLRTGDTIAVVERAEPIEDTPMAEMPGPSHRAAGVRAALLRAAADSEPVLLHGDTGTGKEHAAAAVHRLATRSGPLVRVNVAAIPAGLFESEFFGHGAGAFSGAGERRRGLAREADHGTLVLDEIGELPLELQPKLLRMLEEGRIRPVGLDRDQQVDVKFVASTNADLAARVAQGTFRHDLLARLRHHDVALPPLRHRRADLGDLADAVWPLVGQADRPTRWFDALEADAVEAMLLHGWPDNLRGLRRTLASLSTVTERPVPLSALPEPILATVAALEAQPQQVPLSPQRPSQSGRRKRPSREAMLQLVVDCAGNLEQVGRELGCDRRQVYRWLRANRIDMAEVESHRPDRQP